MIDLGALLIAAMAGFGVFALVQALFPPREQPAPIVTTTSGPAVKVTTR